MNKMVTSREHLLSAAQHIVFTEGLENLSIRHLAKTCQIAIGSVYHYFPSKSDLVFAVVENFWKTRMHSSIQAIAENSDYFLDFVDQIYQLLSISLEGFLSTFLSQLELMSETERTRGKTLEKTYFHHMEREFLLMLKKDQKIRETAFNEIFTPEKFVTFLFSNLITMLAAKETDCSFFKELIRKLLY